VIDRIQAMNLRGRTREQIELLLANESRAELLDRIFSLVTKFGDYFVRAENSIAVPASGVNAWRDSFRVPPKL